MDEQRTPPPQQLEGYDLVDCLGAGAYGEVWQATAPGGLTKAIKYVFGQLKGKRASAELKALERVKQVRHPYLLSLERIEVVDGRLIVVTELADMSLRDRFRDCVQEGQRGIPRDELLGYLAEAAEALDYLATEHQLQHLDVKPENLLLLAGHTKVADFGLVKSINDQTQSIVGGMTPIYAAPEVFQGAPSWRSDQYSLAVMYQELLSGVAPFSGSNAAELTMQHLKDTPDVSSLGEGDRFAVSQALSKAPENRFESCVRFVEALRQAPFSEPTTPGQQAWGNAPAPQTSGVATEVFAFEEEEQAPHPSIALDLPPVASPAIHTPEPVDCPEREFVPTPAAFIGLGGVGGQVLGRLTKKMTQRLGVDAPPPTMPLLYIDTDPHAIQEACRNEGSRGGLTPEQTLLLALRRPQEYREKASSMLRWLSRRWLYNVPRSLRTEGIRPLGRLALFDHARQAMQRVRATLASATAAESHAETDAAGLNFNQQGLRVYLVASINGGAGSAMTTDVAYAVRAILDRLGVADTSITGLMINGSLRGADRSELTRVNAYAWMTEFQHFLDPGNAYPGDEGAGLPGHEAGVPVFDNAYLLDLGDGLDANEVAAGVDNAAEYLMQDTLAPTQHGLDACRHAGSAPRGALRTFSLQRSESAPKAERAAAANRLLASLAESWCGEQDDADESESTGITSHLVRDAATLIGKLQLDSAGLVANCRLAVEQASSLAEQAPARPAGFEEIAHALAAGLFQEIRSDLYRRLLDRGERIVGAGHAADWYRNHLSSVTDQLTQLAATVRQELETMATGGPAPRQHQVRLASLQVATLVTDRVDHLLSDARNGLESLAKAFRSLAADADAGSSQGSPRWQRIIDEQMPEMLREADELLTTEVHSSPTDLLTGDAGESVDVLRRHLDTVVAGVVDRGLTGVVPSLGVEGGGGEGEPLPLPVIAQWGATVRHVVATPRDAETRNTPFDDVEHAVRIASDDGSACLVTECDGLSLPHVAGHLVGGRRDYAELAARVKTRGDIDWSSPIDPPSKAPTVLVDAKIDAELDAGTTFMPTSLMPS